MTGTVVDITRHSPGIPGEREKEDLETSGERGLKQIKKKN